MEAKNIKFKVWRVRLGKLYYVQGYFKNYQDIVENHCSFEYSSYPDVAWLFDYKESAESIADVCGGVVEHVHVTSAEHRKWFELSDKQREFSRGEWNIKGLLELEELEEMN